MCSQVNLIKEKLASYLFTLWRPAAYYPNRKIYKPEKSRSVFPMAKVMSTFISSIYNKNSHGSLTSWNEQPHGKSWLAKPAGPYLLTSFWLCPGGKHRKVQTFCWHIKPKDMIIIMTNQFLAPSQSSVKPYTPPSPNSHKSGFFCIRGLYNWWLHFKDKIVNILGKSPYPFLVSHTCNL